MDAWTLVSRNARGRYFRPVANVTVGTWREARDAAGVVKAANPEADIWFVPTREAQAVGHAEDRDNVLVESGKRIPIRWDAKPLHTA